MVSSKTLLLLIVFTSFALSLASEDVEEKEWTLWKEVQLLIPVHSYLIHRLIQMYVIISETWQEV